MSYRENGAKRVLAGFVVGSLAAGITALLFAPSSGKRLRRSLARDGRRLGRRATDSMASLQERSQAVLDKASESLQEIAEDARRMSGRG